MGAYLSTPKTDKISNNYESDVMTVGASAMQGWRRSQEDAHNAILDYDEENKASFFAVYDGHGGAEVALYCAENLPTFLKSLEAYSNNNFNQALIDAFIGFDRLLIKEEVMSVLKKLAGETNPQNTSDDEDDDENLDELCQEGTLPLNEVLRKYEQLQKNPTIEKLQSSEAVASSSGLKKGSKAPLSPYLRGRREAFNKNGEMDPAAGCSSVINDSSAIVNTQANTIEKCIPNKDEPETNNAGSSRNCSNPDISSSKNDSVQNGSTSEIKAGTSASSSETKPEKENNENKIQPADMENSDSNVDEGVNLENELESIGSSSESDDDDFNIPEAESSTEDGEEGEEEEEDIDFGLACNAVEEPGKDSGCTAVVALIVGKDLYVANAGDSRCVVCRNGSAVEMSLDHKPEDEEETNRIVKAGGKITLDGRVNGGLNLSRAIGDHTYKQNESLPLEEQMISALPDVRKIVITPEDEFMVLACDGIWNFMTSEKVILFIKERIDKGTQLSEICEELFDKCLARDSKGDGTGCDNMTAVIVKFKNRILEQPTNLKPEEIETEFVCNKIEDEDEMLDDSDEEEDSDETQQTLKRSASPSQINGVSANHKRLKTDSPNDKEESTGNENTKPNP